jgi:hypothetical protein
MDDQQADQELERRKSLRLDMENELVALFWEDDGGYNLSKRVVCIDVCNGGISINSDSPMKISKVIEVVLNPRDADSPKRKARILRCIEQETGWYFVGLSFEK